MKQRILTNEAAKQLKKFDPEYYPLLVAWIWYQTNISKNWYFSLTITNPENEEDTNYKYSSSKSITFYLKEDTIEVDQEEPDIKNNFEVSEKSWTLYTFFKNLTDRDWFISLTISIAAAAGFVLGKTL